MKYLYQLGDGFMLKTDEVNFYKEYTGYPYPKLEAPQDDLLYDLYTSYMSYTKYDDFIKNIKSDILKSIKDGLISNDSVGIAETLFANNEKLSLVDIHEDYYVFSGKYSIALTKLPYTKVCCSTTAVTVYVPKHRLQNIVNFVDLNKKVNAPIGHSEYKLDYIYVTDAPYQLSSLVLKDSIDDINKKLQGEGKSICAEFLSAVRFDETYRVRLLNKPVSRYSDSEIADIYNSYVSNVRFYAASILEKAFRKFPFTSNSISVDISKGELHLKLGNKFNIDNDIISPSIFGKFENYFKSFNRNKVVFNMKKLWGDDCKFCLKLLNSLSNYTRVKQADKIDALKSLGINEKDIIRHNLISGKDAFLNKSYMSDGNFDFKGFYEFNILIRSVVLRPDNYIHINILPAFELWTEYKTSLGVSFEEFISNNFDYYEYLVKVFSLTCYSGDFNLYVSSYSIPYPDRLVIKVKAS